MITIGGSVNHLVELGMVTLAIMSIQNDECTSSNYPDADWSSKWREQVLANEAAEK